MYKYSYLLTYLQQLRQNLICQCTKFTINLWNVTNSCVLSTRSRRKIRYRGNTGNTKAERCWGRAETKTGRKMPGGYLEARQLPWGLHHYIWPFRFAAYSTLLQIAVSDWMNPKHCIHSLLSPNKDTDMSLSDQEVTRISSQWSLVNNITSRLCHVIFFNYVQLLYFYFARRSGCEVLWCIRLCVCVCLCVCLSARIYPQPHRDLYQIYCGCCLWPWLTIRRCDVMYFRFCGLHHVFIVGRIVVWISLRRTDFDGIYFFTAKSYRIQFPIIKGHNFD